MAKKDPNKKYLSTNIRPVSRVDISGPCSFIITGINEYGQICFTFETNKKDFVEVYKLKESKNEN